MFDVLPVAHVWADDEDDAIARGKHIIKNNPIYNEHFSDDVKARKNLPGGE